MVSMAAEADLVAADLAALELADSAVPGPAVFTVVAATVAVGLAVAASVEAGIPAVVALVAEESAAAVNLVVLAAPAAQRGVAI